jgi:hypothetical protein
MIRKIRRCYLVPGFQGKRAVGNPDAFAIKIYLTRCGATAMVICRALSGTLSNRNAPKPEPMIVRTIEGSKRLRLRTPLPMNGNEPPTLMKVKASMFVATAIWASMPRAIITGTVIKDVLPVTLITLVRKKIATRSRSLRVGTSSS